MDPLHATIEEFDAEGFTHVECHCPRCRMTRLRPVVRSPKALCPPASVDGPSQPVPALSSGPVPMSERGTFGPVPRGAAVQFTAAVITLGVNTPATTTMVPPMTKTRTRSDIVATTNFIGCITNPRMRH